ERHRRGNETISPLLVAITPEGPNAPYEPQTAAARIDQAVKRGLAWLGASFTTASSPVVGPSIYYGLYGIERLGALANVTTLGRVDWFEQGRRYIESSQRADGAWL